MTVSGLTKKYGDGPAVDGASFEPEPGTVTSSTGAARRGGARS